MISESDNVTANHVAQKLQKIRREKGFERAQFARSMGMNYVAYYQWERGVNVKNIVKFLELCKKLDVNPNYFLQD